MKIIRIITGIYQVNTYIVYKEGHTDAVVIDPGDDVYDIIDILNTNQLTASYIFLTHGHFDHIGAVAQLREKYGSTIGIYPNDSDMLINKAHHTISPNELILSTRPAEILFYDGEKIEAAGLEFTILHTPGHTHGSVCIICENVIFSGDTVFLGSIGRTDFVESNHNDMIKSLEKIRDLPGDYIILPGHGSQTTLQQERLNNPFFVQLR